MSQKMQELSLTDPNVLDQIKLPARQGGVGSRPLGGVNGPVTPSGSLTPSEVSLIAASEPPLAWDREQDLMLSPFSPRSQLSGRFTPTFGNRPSDPQLSPSPGTSSKVKGIMSNYIDQSNKKEKARRLEQLRSGKFGKSKSSSKKWSPPTASQLKVESSQVKDDPTNSQQKLPASGVGAMKQSWEKGGISPRQLEKPEEPAKQEGGFGDVMKRFKQLEGSEKPQADIKAQKAKKLQQMTAAFEQPQGRGQSTTGNKSKSTNVVASEMIRGKAALFEKKK
eukprot:TRINITY_DN1826_c1_g1_i1.p1 TRINITY_DN1826_c1_g1~~TRINITY_DN1826_c1_g1_i1.p1  ORF type:complete len:279 (+),score=51.91 TRINITY_DN1826_c1_g1_i1:52-888(+)